MLWFLTGVFFSPLIAGTMLKAAFAQDSPKKQPKPFVEPPPRFGRLKSGLLLKDEGCARDYVRARGLAGVEKQKLLNDIETYGCASFEKGSDGLLIYAGERVIILSRVVITFGETKVPFRKVALPVNKECPDCDASLGLAVEADILMEGGEPKKR
jgi:hypothetical protein